MSQTTLTTLLMAQIVSVSPQELKTVPSITGKEEEALLFIVF